MADLPLHPDADDDPGRADAGTDRAAARRSARRSARPRWMTLGVGVLAVAVLVLFVVLHLAGVLGPGEHQ